jgi:hypothetical protein
VQQPPEVVARIRKVRMGGSGDAARIDPAENDPKTRRENVRDVARSYAASASSAGRASIRSSKPLRKSSPLTVVGKRGRRGSRWTIVTVESQLP